MVSGEITIFPTLTKPGIKRDGTVLEGQNYVDGQWVRFQRGLPRKIGGYRRIDRDFSGVVRSAYVFPSGDRAFIYGGSSNVLECKPISNDGVGYGLFDVTPSVFSTNENNLWQIDSMADMTGSGMSVIVAHAGQNLADISSNVVTPVYYGEAGKEVNFIDTGAPQVSGGCCTIGPFVMVYGSYGYVAWCAPNDPTNWIFDDTNPDYKGAGFANPTGYKIVKGIPIRGAQNPTVLLFSLGSIVRATYDSTLQSFAFTILSSSSSVLSSSSVIEYDGLVFWIGLDRFMVYDGTIKELPNSMNLNWFFDNLNWSQRQKVWAYKVPRWGEIWWFYPRGSATECTDAIIYNVRENCWYDTSCSRSSGYFSQGFRYPIAFDSSVDEDGKSIVWQHEYGVDRVEDQNLAILSFFETSDVTLSMTSPGGGWSGKDKNILCKRIIPDFVMPSDTTMNVVVTGRGWPQGEQVDSVPYEFTGQTEKIDMKEERFIMRFRFESNQSGGDYQMGQVSVDLSDGGGRPESRRSS